MNLVAPVCMVISTIALVAIALLLASGRLRGPMGPRGAPGADRMAAAAPEPASVPQRSDLCEVLHRTHNGWKHHSWVRFGSEAWQQAYDTPDRALRKDGNLELGVQR